VEGAGEFDLSSWAVVSINPRRGTAAQIAPDARRITTQSTSKELMKRHAVQHCLLLLLPLTILPCVGASQNRDAPEPKQAGPYVIRTNVDLVVLRATIRDRKGASVSGLNKESFQIYEDKVLQRVESFSHDDIPVTVGLVIDSSGSMRPKRSDVIGAALAFVRSSNPEDQVFVVNFNEHVSLGLPANSPFTSNAAQLETALSRNVITGMTALYDAIATGLEQLQKGKWDKKVLIVVSDGGDNASKRNLAQVMSRLNQSSAVIYTMGIFDETDEDRNPRVLKQLSRASGGEAFFPKTLQGILPICEQIARDIRSQYTISFVPTNKKQDGTYRAIDLKVRETPRGRPLSVITRAGYSAPLNLQSSGGGQDHRP
jgi:Ca-activated chloride channel homolog